MNISRRSVCVIGFLLLSVGLAAGQNDAPISSKAPEDRPVTVVAEQKDKLQELIKPYIEKARQTYPDAKARYLRGLPSGEAFFLTTRLRDKAGHFEQVFVRVKEIKDEKVRGQIASKIELVEGYKMGDEYTFAESALMDWTISKPDGTEEGNFVGNFLDHYKPD
jgi:hypothetical protein